MRVILGHALAAALLAFAAGAPAQESFAQIAETLWSDRTLAPAGEMIVLDAPYRTGNDARTRIAAQVVAPEGAAISKVWLVLDENPMPVSAVFDLAMPQPRFSFDVTMRINGPMPIHVVAQTEAPDGTGRLLVAEGFVKTSGQGACAAPPGTDPALALARLGEMSVTLGPAAAPAERLAALRRDGVAAPEDRLDVEIDHPSHSGLQMDQISLLFIPMRYVERIGIALDGRGYAEVTGSISLSENPRLGMSIPAGTRRAQVEMQDTKGTVSRVEATRAGY